MGDTILYEGCNPSCPDLLEESEKREEEFVGAIVPDSVPRISWINEIAPAITAQEYRVRGRCTYLAYNSINGKPGYCCMKPVRPSAQEAKG